MLVPSSQGDEARDLLSKSVSFLQQCALGANIEYCPWQVTKQRISQKVEPRCQSREGHAESWRDSTAGSVGFRTLWISLDSSIHLALWNWGCADGAGKEVGPSWKTQTFVSNLMIDTFQVSSNLCFYGVWRCIKWDSAETFWLWVTKAVHWFDPNDVDRSPSFQAGSPGACYSGTGSQAGSNHPPNPIDTIKQAFKKLSRNNALEPTSGFYFSDSRIDSFTKVKAAIEEMTDTQSFQI